LQAGGRDGIHEGVLARRYPIAAVGLSAALCAVLVGHRSALRAAAQDSLPGPFRAHLPMAVAPRSSQLPVPSPTPSPPDCVPLDRHDYGSLPIEGSTTDRAAVVHPDLNLVVRSFVPTLAALRLVDYGGETDANAPRLVGLLGRLPPLSSAFRVNDWDWSTMRPGGPITQWPVTLLGLRTTAGEAIAVPASGYSIGSGYAVLVLYANARRITLKYTREDNVVQGYTVHLEGLCVDPPLKALYDEMDEAGRAKLPALRSGQTFATAQGDEVLVAIRDSGMFMDPRSRKDWWPGQSDERRHSPGSTPRAP
jgi:hypothetical protein